MSNLLSAQFSRLFKNKLFYILIAVSICYSLYCSRYFFINIEYLFKNIDEENKNILLELGLGTENFLNNWGLPFIIISPILISLIIGREYGDGTIRNKLIAGYTRTTIYFSTLIVYIAAEIIIIIIYNMPTLITAFIFKIKLKIAGFRIPLFSISFKEMFVINAIIFLAVIVFSSLFLFLSINITSKSRGIAASLIAAVLLIMLSNYVGTVLWSTDDDYFYYESENYIDPDDFETLTDYFDATRGIGLSKTKYNIYCFADDIIPLNQISTAQTADKIPTRTGRYIIYDLTISTTLTVLGIVIFNRRDLN